MSHPHPSSALPTIRTIGGVRIDGSGRPLSAAKRQLLAVLAAAGADGLTAVELAAELGGSAGAVNAPALRMAIARLRDHLPDGWLPDSAAGRYRLTCAAHEVDAWLVAQLATQPALDDVADDVLMHLLRPDAAFADVDPTPLVERAERALADGQRSVLAALLEQSPQRVTGALVEHMRRHRAEDPYDERLLFLTASRLAAIGDRRGALDVLSTGRRDLAEIGLGPSARVAELERRLLDGTYGEEAQATQIAVPVRHLPVRLRDQLAYEFVGDRTRIEAALIHLLQERGPVLVEGVTGSGKTRLVSELAAAAVGEGWAVVDIVGNEAAVDGSLAPFLAALPPFRDEAAAIFGRAIDPASRRAELWVALRRAIDAAADGARTLVVVDDVQWLDSQSAEFVGHLVGSQGPISLAIAGRSDAVSRSAWRMLRDAVRRAGALEIGMTPMAVEAIRDIVRARHPSMAASTSWSLAEEVHERGGGWPGMALLLLASADRDWHLPDARSLSVPPTLQDSLRERVSSGAHEVGVAAAVIGEAFDVELLQRVCDREVDSLLDDVDELVRNELLVERSLTRFASAHALVDAAFIQSATRSQLARMHQRAAMVVGPDVHRRARHLVGALPLADHEEVAAALRASATAYVAEDLHLEASRRFREVAEVLGRPLAPDDAVAYSRALDLCGLHGDAERVRSEVFELAIAADDAELALRAATSGLPESEPIDGAPALVARLRAVPVDGLRRSSAWVRSHHLGRQLAIVGDLDAAAVAADRAAATAADDDEAVASALVRRFAVSATSDPALRLAVLDAIAGLVDGVAARLQAEYWVVRTIDLYEAGDREAALDAHARLCAVDGLPIQRRWHAGLLEATLAADAGALDDARQLRASTFDMASRAGLREAENAFLIGEFVDLFLDGAAGVLLGAVDDGSLDPDENTLMRAGVCAVLGQAGQVERALPHAELVAKSVIESPISQGVAALAVVADVLGRSEDAQLRERVREMLLRRGSSAIVIGAGAACVGPVERYAAMLAVDDRDRVAHRGSAHAFAVGSGIARWTRITV